MVRINLSRLGLVARGACAAAIAGLGLASCSTTSPPSTASTSTSSTSTASSASSPGIFDAFKQKPQPASTVLLIQSNPGGAQAKTSFGKTCTTPCTMLISESADFTVALTLAGYLPQTAAVHAKMSPAGWTTPASLAFDPPSLFLTLEKATSPAVARKPSKPPA